MEGSEHVKESKMRVNVKQTSKGIPYFDITAKGDTEEELKYNMAVAKKVADETCQEIKKNINKDPEQ